MQASHSVLVIDDEKDIREMLRFALLADGYSVSTAADGVEGLEHIRREMPHAVLLDLMMPRMNGYEVLDNLRNDGVLNSLPVVILTARNLEETDQDRLMGVRAIYQKGQFDVITLVKNFSTVLR